ncbi:MAG: hypothetical protein JSU96_02235 [Acidobacteriota bacterium]|nr:MAG: hypothetical protein JSU96_02235 [Acidobacteriota bacterium]
MEWYGSERWRVLKGVLLCSGAFLFALTAALTSDELPQSEQVFGAISPSDVANTPYGFYPAGTRLGRWISGEEFETIAAQLAVTSRPDISFDGTRMLLSALTGPDSVAQIWELNTDSGKPRQMFSSARASFSPHYLPNNRIVYSQLVGEPGEGLGLQSRLFTSELDGSDQTQITFGEGFQRIIQILPDGRILYGSFDSPEDPPSQIAVRPDGTEADLYVTQRALVASSDEYITFSERLPLAFRKHLRENRPGFRKTTPLPTDDGDIVDVFTAASRPRPPIATSVVKPGLDHGWLLCLDASESTFSIPSREVSAVRVWDSAADRLLGSAPVEADGSFFLEVPADRSLRLEIVDAEGKTLAEQGSGIWVRPNESRGCIGCHEDRTLSPENRIPLAVSKPAVKIAEAREKEVQS